MEGGEAYGARDDRAPLQVTLHSTPYILHLSPYTLHPILYTPHHTPYTLGYRVVEGGEADGARDDRAPLQVAVPRCVREAPLVYGLRFPVSGFRIRVSD